MTSFNPDELFAIAERIERNGADFYKEAARRVSDPKLAGRLNELAAMELDHERTFSGLRSTLTARERQPAVFDPEDQTVLYLQAIADGNVFDISSSPDDFFNPSTTPRDIFSYALDREKESIVFYAGMKNFLRSEENKRRVDAIIKEEISHIVQITREMAALD
ncbi:ferritin family protein [bacterium]|nr:ferritin family protein [candidate division CSSED10-310 bacterium]